MFQERNLAAAKHLWRRIRVAAQTSNQGSRNRPPSFHQDDLHPSAAGFVHAFGEDAHGVALVPSACGEPNTAPPGVMAAVIYRRGGREKRISVTVPRKYPVSSSPTNRL